MSRKREGKREIIRESVRDVVEEFVDEEILEALGDNDYVVKMPPKSSYVIEGTVKRIEKEEEKQEKENTCRCNVKEDEDCICYFYNKKRASELEKKLGKEKFRKKQLVDELTQILIEYDC
jgi:replicative superfamily II helicase